ncbi:MAG: hypothetical protein CTY12_02065 [Methylotenera sp.]|nr:MAG: hypothetical protein CTY12_02065 [Methylotenera sp.]
MELKAIRTEDEYNLALKEISPFFDSEPTQGTDDFDRFEMLLILIESYESKHYPMAPPDPSEAIKFRMEQEGLIPKFRS